MIHVRKRSKQKYSEACRPLLGKKVDGIWGSLSTLPLYLHCCRNRHHILPCNPAAFMAFSRVFGIRESNLLTIAILVVICV